ncbi:uncharacterized protein LOC143026081 [Oratosquilla oratoria]|uniref:uncharacterized protein LOC143026081 n=1 Tax=Oratosquilla oratoria TaxID=337810 RepID=UPI003F75BEF3
MGMKINVMYRGIVYRVRGIKVLCSVVTAVIILLVTIVGLGVWMLVDSYAGTLGAEPFEGNNFTTFASDDLTDTSSESSRSSVLEDDLTTSAGGETSTQRSSDETEVNQAVGFFQGVTPKRELEGPAAAPVTPDYGSFTKEWSPVKGDAVAGDSEVQFSETRPVAVVPPRDFSNRNNAPSYHNNRRLGRPPPPGDYHRGTTLRPHFIPKDVDPSLYEPGSLSILSGVFTTRGPSRRRNGPGERGGDRRRPGEQERISRPSYPVSRNPAYDGEPHPQRAPSRRRPQQHPTDRYPHSRPHESISLQDAVTSPSFPPQFSINPDLIPAGFSLPSGFTPPAAVGSQVTALPVGVGRPPIGGHGGFDDMMYFHKYHERDRIASTPAPRNPPTQQGIHRTGPAEAEEVIEEHPESTGGPHYQGPPVVGYGEEPYSNYQRDQDMYQHLWNAYKQGGEPPGPHDDRSPSPEPASRPFAVPGRPRGPPVAPRHPSVPGATPRRPMGPPPPPHMRGGPPTRDEAFMHVRPDAQLPAHRPPRPEAPPHLTPDRLLWVGFDDNPERVTTPGSHQGSGHVPESHRPYLGPLHDVYEYSKKIADSLLSFPVPTVEAQMKNASTEYIEHTLGLLEEYNKVFSDTGTTADDVLPDMFSGKPERDERLMLVDTETLRSLSPIEMSLVTWTFLDFWEFLVEEVGTLSREDLQVLESRLARLRQRKDAAMARSIVNETVHQVVQANHNTSALSLPRVLDVLQEDVDEGRGFASSEARLWNPFRIFNSQQRIQFMQFAMRVLLKFGKVYLRKQYALDCMMLLFCKELNQSSKKDGMDGISAKVKSVGLKVLTAKEGRAVNTISEVWRALSSWEVLQCEAMFPKCDGTKALEIVNEVANGSRRK